MFKRVTTHATARTINGENELEDYEPFLCHAAARSGQLEELKEMRENGCPWDRWTCTAAAERGHLEMQNWTRTNGCPV